MSFVYLFFVEKLKAKKEKKKKKKSTSGEF